MTETQTTTLYELINPSDPYTFRAASIEVAGVAAAMLSKAFGATEVGGEESTPVMFGWDEWMDEHQINESWITENLTLIADALDSFLIGSADRRADVEDMLEQLPDDKRQEWKDRRQDRHRSSMNQIGERAYELAGRLREKAESNALGLEVPTAAERGREAGE